MPGEPITCAIHQPNLLPRLSTLAKLYAAHHWVVLDDVQFCRRDYQHRCRLAPLASPTSQRWLSLPVHLRNGRATLIRDVTLVDAARDRTRVAALLRQFYARGADRRVLETIINEVTTHLERSNRLLDVTEASTLVLLRLLGWPGRHVRSSSLSVSGGRSERLADLAVAVGAELYLCGTGGAKYLDESPFTSRGISVKYFRFPSTTEEAFAQANRASSLYALMALGPEQLSKQLKVLPAPQLLRAAIGATLAPNDLRAMTGHSRGVA